MRQDRDGDDLRDLYAACYSRLVGVLTVAYGSTAEAEECVQEAFVRLLPRWQRVSQYDDPEAWLRTVAFRLLANRARKERNALRTLLRLGPVPPTPPPAENPVAVRHALAQLPAGHREVLVLHYLAGLDVRGIADVLRVPEGTVKSRLSRARSALAPLLRDEEVPHVP